MQKLDLTMQDAPKYSNLDRWQSTYKSNFQVTDNITVTPALFYLSRPFGQQTGSSASTGGAGADTFSTLGGLVLTTFKF